MNFDLNSEVTLAENFFFFLAENFKVSSYSFSPNSGTESGLHKFQFNNSKILRTP